MLFKIAKTGQKQRIAGESHNTECAIQGQIQGKWKFT